MNRRMNRRQHKKPGLLVAVWPSRRTLVAAHPLRHPMSSAVRDAIASHGPQRPPGRPRPHLGFQMGAAGGALALHLLLLSQWPVMEGSVDLAAQDSSRRTVIEVLPPRPATLPSGGAVESAPHAKTTTPAVPSTRVAAAQPLAQARAASRSSNETPATSTPAAAAPAEEGARLPGTRPDNSGNPSADTLPSAVQAGAAAPTYSTDPAPAVTLDFDFRRGQHPGTAQLHWAPQGDRYSLTLQTQIEGRPGLGWQSHGSWDSAGLAPERYTEGRNGRAARAANFQRDQGVVSYSAQTQSFALPAGLQDRSSWLLQLGAVLQANETLREVGTDIHLWVTGTRGRPELWTFQVLAQAPLTLQSGQTTQALHLLRAPSRLYDTEVQVWLDPAQHHLPLRLQMLLHATGEGLQFELRSLQWK